MDKKPRVHKPHILVVICPTQGHINPLLQFAKRLASKGLKATIATTHYTVKYINAHEVGVSVEPISDGFDNNGISEAPSASTYMEQFKQCGSRTLGELIVKLDNSGDPVSCIVYDSFLPWALDVAKAHGLYGATFFTMSAAVSSIYYLMHHGLMTLDIGSKTEEPLGVTVPISGFPPMRMSDLPSFLTASSDSYPAFLAAVMDQFSNLETADWTLANTFEPLEEKVVKAMTSLCEIKTIGPMIPSAYLDGRIKGDKGYGANLWKPIDDECLKWLTTKPDNSVVYVSFGSRVELTKIQMEELAMGLKDMAKQFIWVLKESEWSKLPDDFTSVIGKNGLLVAWCVQLEVLAHRATGCFITHCGWNSTLEGLSLGVPMLAMPQWTDQPTNAKFVEEVWEVGIRAKVDGSGIVRREELHKCVKKITEGKRSQQIKRNCDKWRKLAKEAIAEGGSSDKNIEAFVAQLLRSNWKRGRENIG